MEKKKNYPGLKKYCRDLGIDLFGVADISAVKNEFMLSPDLLQKLSRAVCLGMRLSSCILGEIKHAPTRLYFHHYRTVNSALDQAALKVSHYIQDQGFQALAIPASQIIDWQNQKGHLSHKKIGYLAGLGWVGRNNLLVNKKLGSQFRLVSILTEMPLKADKPLKDECGECFLCVEACPCNAIKDKAKDFNHQSCFEKLRDFQKKRLVDQYICGVCVKVCRGK
jgi:epoxyqueuosine reductase QueG